MLRCFNKGSVCRSGEGDKETKPQRHSASLGGAHASGTRVGGIGDEPQTQIMPPPKRGAIVL